MTYRLTVRKVLEKATTLISSYITLLHHGMVIVGLPYSETRQTTLDEINGS